MSFMATQQGNIVDMINVFNLFAWDEPLSHMTKTQTKTANCFMGTAETKKSPCRDSERTGKLKHTCDDLQGD